MSLIGQDTAARVCASLLSGGSYSDICNWQTNVAQGVDPAPAAFYVNNTICANN
jgi:hypothetical protein